MRATMTVEEIKRTLFVNKFKVAAYGGKDGYISEISFSKKAKDGRMFGFSYDVGCGLRQITLKRLFKRIQSVYPKLKLEV